MVIRQPKKSIGRKRIEIRKIEKKESLQVSFSKRRTGLFKKAGELSILSGAEIAVIAISPAGHKVYAFGNPSADAVIDRFLAGDKASNSIANTVLRIEEKEQLGLSSDADTGFWWNRPISGMELPELEKFRDSLVNLQHRVVDRVDELMVAAFSPSKFLDVECKRNFKMVMNH